MIVVITVSDYDSYVESVRVRKRERLSEEGDKGIKPLQEST